MIDGSVEGYGNGKTTVLWLLVLSLVNFQKQNIIKVWEFKETAAKIMFKHDLTYCQSWKISFKILIETKIVKGIVSVYPPECQFPYTGLTWHYQTWGKILLDFICFAFLLLKVILSLKCLKTICIFNEHLFMWLACCVGVGCVYHCFWRGLSDKLQIFFYCSFSTFWEEL